MKILIGTPTYDRRIDIELVRIFIHLERENKAHSFDYMFPVSSHLSRNRNYVCQSALQNGHDAVLFLDSDIAIEDHSFITDLVETAYKHDAGIVGGAYRAKKDEYTLVAGNFKDGEPDNLKELPKVPVAVDYVGTGIMLIMRSVLQTMPEPHFTIIDKPGLKVMPEDYEFCRKAKEKGATIMLDPRFKTQHYGAFGWATF